MAASKTTDVVITHTFKPSETAEAILGMIPTKRALFLWGPPGISKSAVSKQVATMLGIAFIDVRLSQMDPTDLRGIPFPTTVGGLTGVAWSAPLVLPRDLDHRDARDIEAIETPIKFYNPRGSNKIHYCPSPTVTVSSLTDGLFAEVSDERPDQFTVVLKDVNGKAHPGRVHYHVEGLVKGIVALEEFNSAPPSVQAASYQLILDRALGDYEVPEGVYLIAMGNRDIDRGVTFKMPTPIMNRFVHAEMVHDHEDWMTWALGEFIHEDVVGFLMDSPDHLFQFNPGTAARGFQTPRSWEFVSDILHKNGETLPTKVLKGLIIGAVGDAAGLLLMTHRDNKEMMPDPRLVLSGAIKKMPSKEFPVSLAYSMTTTLCYMLTRQINEIKMTYSDKKDLKNSPEFAKWCDEADNFIAFVLGNFKPEITIMGAKAALSVHKLPFDAQKMKNFEAFALKYRQFIL